jgi:DNA-binding IclR family transcriptional regulator
MAAGAGVRRALTALSRQGLARRERDGRWVLTAAGVDRGRRLVDGEGGP